MTFVEDDYVDHYVNDDNVHRQHLNASVTLFQKGFTFVTSVEVIYTAWLVLVAEKAEFFLNELNTSVSTINNILCLIDLFESRMYNSANEINNHKKKSKIIQQIAQSF